MGGWLRLRARKEWQFFAALPHADRPLALLWWAVVLLHGLLPAMFAVAMGALVSAVQHGDDLGRPLAVIGVVFVLLQVITPIQTAVSHSLGDRTAAWLYDRLTWACVRPPGMAHLEDPALTADLTVAREFDCGMTGPPLSYSMDFIAGGLVGMIGGLTVAVVLFGFAWWAPLVLTAAWLSTHWLLRESAVWFDRNTDEVRSAQRVADYAYRLAVDAPASKELRLFGLVDWTIARFVATRTRLHQLQYEATRLRERPLAWCVIFTAAANLAVMWALWAAAASGRIDLGALVAYAQCTIGTSLIAFGGLNWALDGAAAPVAAVARLEPAMATAGALVPGQSPAAGLPAHEIRFRDVAFAYPGGSPVLNGFDLTIPAGSSLAIVGQNGAGKTTLAKLLCRFYDPQAGAIEIDGRDVRAFDVAAWRSRLTAVFQDFLRLELPLRDNVAPAGAPDARGRQRAGGRGGGPARRPGHRAGARLRRRHRSVGRPVAAGGARSGALCGDDGRRGRAARRTDRPARRPRRGRDLRAAPGRHPALHDDPHLAPLLDGAAGRSDLRARARQGRRTGIARRADGPRRTLPHDVRFAGAALHRRRGGPDL